MKTKYHFFKFDSVLITGFILIVLLFSIPLVYLSIEFSQRFKNEIEFVQSEINGTKLVTYVFSHANLLFEEKLNKDTSTLNNDYLQMKKMDESFVNVKSVISQIFNKGEENNEKLKRLEMVFSLKDYEYSLNKRNNNVVLYSYLQRKLNKATVLIADESKLLLDPESFTYHLMELGLLQAPKLLVELLELEERARLKQITPKELFDSLAKVEEKIEEISFNVDNLKEQARSSSETHADFEQLVITQNQLTESYIDLLFYFESLKNQNLQKDFVKVSEHIRHISTHIFSMQDLAVHELRHHLQERLMTDRHVYNMTMVLTVLIWVLSVALSTYLFLFITRKKQSLQSTIDEQQSQLVKNAKLALLGEMATGIGHEIASPLTVISGMLTILERKMTKYPDEIKADLEKTVGRGHKMVDRINFIIKSMKGYVHQTEQSELKPIQILEAIDESLVLAKAKALKFGIELQSPDNIDQQLYVLGTESEVCQCILNLISNSIDAVSKQSDRKIEIEVSSERDFVFVRINDNGPGVPAEIRQKIFESLFSTKQVGEGTGLGLSLVSRIMQRLGGKIELLDSKVGASFQLTFKKSSIQTKVQDQAS